MHGFSIIEEASTPQEQACKLTLFLLLAVREYVKVTPWSGQGVRLVIVIEEAHNIVGRNRDATASEENADPKAFASEFVCRMLAELRSLGVGIIIVDQLPSAVAPEVNKNTASKLTFRIVGNDDRDELGGNMLYGSTEYEETARLQPGEAYYYTEGYFGPRRIRTPNLHEELGLPPPPMGKAILPFLQDDEWFIEAANTRITAEFEQLREEMDGFDGIRMAVIKGVVTLNANSVRILASHPPGRRVSHFTSLVRQAKILRKRLDLAFRAFRRDAYRPLLGQEMPDGIGDEWLRSYRSQLLHRFESVIEPDTKSCLKLLDRFIRDPEKIVFSERKDHNHGTAR